MYNLSFVQNALCDYSPQRSHRLLHMSHADDLQLNCTSIICLPWFFSLTAMVSTTVSTSVIMLLSGAKNCGISPIAALL